MKNNNTGKKKTCPQCNSSIPQDAPSQLCPSCVLDYVASLPDTSTSNSAEQAPPSIEQLAPHFPDFKFEKLIGAGGMGSVYKAHQTQVDRTVSIKILSEKFSEDPVFNERFVREAKILGKLNHPNITAIFDFGIAGPYCYLVMEYVDGVNLRQALRTGNFSPSESLAIIQEICVALAYAHDEGILHRDIKPENILLDSKGRIKIADFGIAKLIDEQDTNNITLTVQGSALGSPHYMAPEQLETPDDIDQRADIYSLGVVFYEILTGELPLGRFPLPSQKANIDTRIDEIVLRTLERERQARYQDANEVITQVDAIKNSPPPTTSESNRTAAKFSILAPILSCIGIACLIATIYAANELSRSNLKEIVIIVGTLFTISSFLTGSILGLCALREIRKSNGLKEGAVGSVLAVIPISFCITSILFWAASMFISTSLHGNSAISLVPPILFATQLLNIFIIYRALLRWANGIYNSLGDRIHPSPKKSILIAILLALLTPIFTVIIIEARHKDYSPEFDIDPPQIIKSSNNEHE